MMRKLDSYIKKYGEKKGRRLYTYLQKSACYASLAAQEKKR